MAESLLSPSGIKLFGREFPGFDKKNLGTGLGDNNFLRKQIDKAGARFARIYGFAYEGAYYPLSRPAVFLVHTTGKPAPPDKPASPKVARGPSDTDRSGEARKDADFSTDIMMWEYDTGDFSLRLDITAGTFEDILLDAEIDAHLQMASAAKMQTAGAAKMQISHAAKMQIGRRSD